MIGRIVRKKKFRYTDARNMTRTDEPYFDRPVEVRFVTPSAGDPYEPTERGKAAAEFGPYEV